MREQLGVVLTVARDSTLARLQLAYLGSNMAEFGTWMAILVYAYGLGGAGTAALFALAQLLPAGVVAPFVAALGDRYRRDRVLLVGYLWQGAGLAATALMLYADAPPVAVLATATVAAASYTLPRPLQSVLLPSLTHSPGDLTAANAVSGLAETVGIFVGPLVGGLLLGRSEPGDVFVAFAVVAFLGAALVARLPSAELRHGHRPPETQGRRSLSATLGRYVEVARAPGVLLVVGVLTAATIVVGALDILFVATAIDLLQAGESWAGFLYAAFGFGGVLGAAATVALIGRRRLTPALAVSGGVYGIPIALLGVVPSTLIAPILAVTGGAGSSIASVAARTLLQRVAPEAMLARIFGVLEGLSMLALALGSVAAGLIVAILGIAWALVFAGLLVPTLLLFVWIRLGALDRDARAPDPEALELVRRIPIFAPMSAPTIERILGELTWVELPAGQVIIREGDIGDRFYILASGEVQVSIRGKGVSVRGPGDHFGEIALLRSVPRTATVTAVAPVRLIAIERDRFLEAITGHPQSHERAEASATEQLSANQ